MHILESIFDALGCGSGETYRASLEIYTHKLRMLLKKCCNVWPFPSTTRSWPFKSYSTIMFENAFSSFGETRKQPFGLFDLMRQLPNEGGATLLLIDVLPRGSGCARDGSPHVWWSNFSSFIDLIV